MFYSENRLSIFLKYSRERAIKSQTIMGRFFVAPAIAKCDIGVRFSVRPSSRPSFRPQFTSTLAFKSI